MLGILIFGYVVFSLLFTFPYLLRYVRIKKLESTTPILFGAGEPAHHDVALPMNGRM